MDQETYDWLSSNAAALGLTIRRLVGLRLILDKNFEDLKRLNGDATMLDAAFKYLERLKAEGEALNEKG